jgi:putative membrane-bound dehydrogenase-like protein
MGSARWRAITLAVLVTTATGYAYQTSSQAPSWPPAIQKTSAAAPVRSPLEALKTFSLPPGYRLELVASEPLVQDPILIEWDTARRMWVVELPGYMRTINGPGEYDPVGRVVILEDSDGNGAMDKRTVFADGLIQPRALKVLERGVLVGEPPNVWLLTDDDGDLRADRKELVTSGYGREETNVEVNANGLLWGLDNRIHVSGTGADFYLRLKDGKFEPQPSLSRGQWGITQDDAGRVYRNHNESVLHVDLVATPYYARNPNLMRTRGSHEPVIDPQGDINAVWPSRETPGTNRAYQYGILRENSTLAAFTAACAPTVYRGDRLPAELQGDVFVAEPAANVVSRIKLSDDGTALRGRKAYENTEFITSTDERFRPVYLSNAPDGTLYVVDMYRGIIQHRMYITEYLRDQILARKLEQPIGLGRIYRVDHETTQRDLTSVLPTKSTTEIVDVLTHPSGWWRDAAQQALVARSSRRADSAKPQGADAATVAALVKLAGSTTGWRARLHALWTLDGIGAVDLALVIKALGDSSRDVRASALRIAERWLTDSNHPVQAAVMARLDDRDWFVRRQLGASLGALPLGRRETAVVAFLERHATDPIALDAALSGLRGVEAPALETLLRASAVPSQERDAAIAMLTTTVIRSGHQVSIQEVFGWAAEQDRPVWQRSALLRGAEIALLGAAMPGMPPSRRPSPAAGAVPCPTCPGGRAGPGGAYAFRSPEELGSGGTARGSNRASSGLRLNSEPLALVAWASRNGDMALRVSALLERMVWPGKRGDAAAIPPLTPDEQRRFDGGREVYRNICQACHQPDGRGQERLAPTLLGSVLTLAQPEVPVRILLNGKEGPDGLMPPVGSVLSDDQIAAVLTYVRREWGQSATAVDAATVANVRALTAGRSRPWTEAELMKMVR